MKGVIRNSFFTAVLIFCSAGFTRGSGDKDVVVRKYSSGNFVRVSAANSSYLELDNGEHFMPAGINICWPRFVSSEDSVINKMKYYLNQLGKNGGNFTRIWLSAPAFEVEHEKAGSYDEVIGGMTLHDYLYAAFFAGAAGPGQSWQWDYYIDKRHLWYHFTRFNKAIPGLDPRSEDFKPFISEQNRLTGYGLQGKKAVLRWCRDQADTWGKELVQGVKQLSALPVTPGRMW